VDGQAKTPQRATVIAAKAFAQELGIPIPKSLVRKVTSVAERVQTRILASKQVRTRHNIPDSGPDPRGPKRVITRSETAVITAYVDDESIPLNNRGAPWLDVAEASGVQLPQTYHYKPPGYRTIEPQSIRRACQVDEDMFNAACEEEKKLTDTQAIAREDWSEEQLAIRPRSYYWKDVAFCDEFHFGIGPQVTQRVKRKKGKEWRYKPYNIHRKPVTSKDVKAKAREEEHLKLLNVFVIIGFDFRKLIPYKVPNNMGKITTKVYTSHILPSVKEELKRDGLTLCQDADSAHTSKATLKYANENGIKLLTLPGVSPDFSIAETMAQLLKRAFHKRRCASEKAALARFRQVFNEIDQGKV
jgi:DDE superfamily endonuclease